jgi:hypothetical protein
MSCPSNTSLLKAPEAVELIALPDLSPDSKQDIAAPIRDSVVRLSAEY